MQVFIFIRSDLGHSLRFPSQLLVKTLCDCPSVWSSLPHAPTLSAYSATSLMQCRNRQNQGTAEMADAADTEHSRARCPQSTQADVEQRSRGRHKGSGPRCHIRPPEQLICILVPLEATRAAPPRPGAARDHLEVMGKRTDLGMVE